MTDCCSAERDALHPHKRRCPRSGGECAEVAERTIAHHLRNAWEWQGAGQRYFFCADPACDVVYFGEDGSLILKGQLRTTVGIKETADTALLCYCFGVSKADALHDAKIRDYVVEQTRLGLCSCESSNPAGRCCLKDFPRMRE